VFWEAKSIGAFSFLFQTLRSWYGIWKNFVRLVRLPVCIFISVPVFFPIPPSASSSQPHPDPPLILVPSLLSSSSSFSSHLPLTPLYLARMRWSKLCFAQNELWDLENCVLEWGSSLVLSGAVGSSIGLFACLCPFFSFPFPLSPPPTSFLLSPF
jgi:hypothetical protein